MRCKNGCQRDRFKSAYECLLCLQWRRAAAKAGIPGFGYTSFNSQVYRTKECWEWIGPLTASGYGLYRSPSKTTHMAHRASYDHYVGRIRAGMEIDHLCKNRACVNPKHLEQVTKEENIRRRDNDKTKSYRHQD